MKKQSIGTSGQEIPEELRKLAKLTLFDEFKSIDEKIRHEAVEKDEKYRAEVEALLVRLVPIDKELREKIRVLNSLTGEFCALRSKTQKARQSLDDFKAKSLQEVKEGHKGYKDHLVEDAAARAAIDAKDREYEAIREPVLKEIRSLDDEIKRLQIAWLEIEYGLKSKAVDVHLDFLNALETKVKKLKWSSLNINTVGLRDTIRERQRQSNNYRKDSVIFPMTVRASVERAPALLFDSRIPSKHLPRLREILAEIRDLPPGQEINLTLIPDNHPNGGGLQWSNRN
jgi:hypothetical protein